MTTTLRKYKKLELINLIVEYEETMETLRDEKTNFETEIEDLYKQLELANNPPKQKKNKVLEYLQKRLKVVKDERRFAYKKELNRLLKN
jgi:cell division protein FtsB